MSDSQDKDTQTDAEEKPLSASMNPLKSHFGLDIGLPKPLVYVLDAILLLFVVVTKTVLYTLLGLLASGVTFLFAFPAYCAVFSSETLVTCATTQYLNLYVIGASALVGLIVITTVRIVDVKINWQKHF